MGKSVMVPSELLDNVLHLICLIEDHWSPTQLPANIRDTMQQIERQLSAKIAAMERREAFTEYKTAPAGSALRETSRQNYLDRAGIHKDWQTQRETPLD